MVAMVEYYIGACYQSMLNFIAICRTRPQDALAFIFLVTACVLTYLYGTFLLLPILLDEFPVVCLLMGITVTSWLCFGILANLILCRIRDSSIINKILMQPVVKPPPELIHPIGTDNVEEHLIKERVKYIGQQFMAKPFGEEEPWHICASCEIFVPPRSWHCQFCKTCILRRDHHCIFAMSCIGEENHSNFLGLLFYLGCGTSLATAVNMTYTVYYTETVWWMYIVKAFVPFYVILFDFSVMNMLAGVNIIGQFAAWFILLYYMRLAAIGQTSADNSRGINPTPESGKQLSIANLKEMLGPHPFLRIIWPFHPIHRTCYITPVSNTTNNRKGM